MEANLTTLKLFKFKIFTRHCTIILKQNTYKYVYN